jgi:hypothetical protein
MANLTRITCEREGRLEQLLRNKRWLGHATFLCVVILGFSLGGLWLVGKVKQARVAAEHL